MIETTMKVELVRFNATDGINLQGWYSNADAEVVVIHIHGMSGNGYENKFLDSLRATYSKSKASFLTINTRGHEIVTWLYGGKKDLLGGSCYEIFEESVFDIEGAINFVKSRGKTKIILEGHSLGCTKVVNYLVGKNESIKSAILLAPTDMTGWAKTDPKHDEYVATAKRLIAEGKLTDLVSFECWEDKTPISAPTYLGICEAGSSADIYGEREGGAILGRLQLPTLIAYGTKDNGIVNIDGSIENYLSRVNKIKNENTQIAVIAGAEHSFSGFEEKLSEAIKEFITKIKSQ